MSVFASSILPVDLKSSTGFEVMSMNKKQDEIERNFFTYGVVEPGAERTLLIPADKYEFTVDGPADIFFKGSWSRPNDRSYTVAQFFKGLKKFHGKNLWRIPMNIIKTVRRLTIIFDLDLNGSVILNHSGYQTVYAGDFFYALPPLYNLICGALDVNTFTYAETRYARPMFINQVEYKNIMYDIHRAYMFLHENVTVIPPPPLPPSAAASSASTSSASASTSASGAIKRKINYDSELKKLTSQMNTRIAAKTTAAAAVTTTTATTIFPLKAKDVLKSLLPQNTIDVMYGSIPQQQPQPGGSQQQQQQQLAHVTVENILRLEDLISMNKSLLEQWSVLQHDAAMTTGARDLLTEWSKSYHCRSMLGKMLNLDELLRLYPYVIGLNPIGLIRLKTSITFNQMDTNDAIKPGDTFDAVLSS